MKTDTKFYNVILVAFIILTLSTINCSYAASAMTDALNGGAGSTGTSNNKNPTVSSGSSSAMDQALNGGASSAGTSNNKNPTASSGSSSAMDQALNGGSSSTGTSNNNNPTTPSGSTPSGSPSTTKPASASGNNKGGASATKTKNIDTIDGVIGAADDFISGAKTENTIDQQGLQNTIDLIYNILLAIGMVVAVVAGIVLGIQFMTASADGKAEVKEKLIPYVVGCVVIFGAFGIWKLIMVLIGTF